MAEAAAALGSQLKSDRFIKLFLGKNNDEPYLVPESRLKQTSEYFANAIKHESWGPDNIGKLHFPDDGKDAFELLIYFIVNGSMPVFNLYKSRNENFALQKTLIDSWVMADKYLIPDFQDQVMLKLLETVDFFPSDWEVVRHAFERGSEGSKIWTLFAEEAVFKTYYGMPRKIKTPDEIRKLERAISGIPGALCQFIETRESSRLPSFAGRLGQPKDIVPFLHGAFAPDSKARFYTEVLQAARAKMFW